MSRPVSVSVVLPAYDEAGRLREAVGETHDALDAFLPAGSFEVIVAEDGCTDRTPKIARELADEGRVRHVHSDERLGRGRALEEAFRAARGETLVYFDCDLATDLSHLEELVESVRSGGYDVATGSRRLAERRADRPARRRLPSAAYNGLVRVALGSDLRDHQCGFKAFDRTVLEDVLPSVEDGHWFWDTEVLVAAQRAGYRVREFPVEWTPRDDTDVDLVRDGLGMGGQLARTWWQRAVRPRIGRRSRLLAGSLLVVLAVVALAASVDLAGVLGTMAGADPVLLAGATVLYALSWPIRGVRYRDILARLGHCEGVGFLTAAVLVSQTGNLAFPARAGDAVRAYVLGRHRGIPYPTGFASLAIERVFDLLTVLALAAAVLAGFLVTGTGEGLRAALSGAGVGGDLAHSGRVAVAVAAVVGAGAVLAVATLVATARSDRSLVRKGTARFSSDAYAARIGDLLAGFVRDIRAVATDRQVFAVVGASSLLIWSLDAVVAAAVLRALGADLALPALLSVCVLAVSVGNLAKVMPLTPGGIGLYEGAFTLLVVVLVPVSPSLALAAAVVDHAIKNLVTVAGGTGAMVALDVSLSTAVEEGERGEEVAAGEGYGSD